MRDSGSVITSNIPELAKEGECDNFGNVCCKVCNTLQSPTFKECIKCCQHNTLVFKDAWSGSDDVGVWGVECECRDCGKNFGFTRDVLEAYIVVRKNISERPN